MILAAALLLASAIPADLFAVTRRAFADVTDRRTQAVTLSATKPLSIEITIGAVRVEGWDKPGAEIAVERRVPTSAQFARLPLRIDDTPERVTVRAIQEHGGTDPALKADVTVRVPRTAVIDRVSIIEGRIELDGFAGAITAAIQRGPIDGKDVSGALRLETNIGSIALTNARLSPDGLLRLRTFNGDVTLSLAQRPANARILALALNGHVKSDIPLTMRNTWGPRFGETTIGKGEPVISLDVVTGTVEIRAPGSGLR